MPPSATMTDIARRVGVHRMTVSNVLNGRLASKRSDAAERAAEIRRVAEEMGYRRNTAAVATRTGKTGFVGMIRSPLVDHSVHEPAFDSGLDEALHEHGLCLVRDIIDDDATQAPRIVEENAVDGLLINYAFGTPEPVRELLDRCHIPAIWINRKRDFNCVRPHDEGAAYEATRRMLQLGHRRITLLNDIYNAPGTANHYSHSDRVAGYRRAMNEAGLAIDFRSVPRRPSDTPHRAVRNHTLDNMRALLESPDRPTAVLCLNNGRVLLHAAALAGLSVPNDLSVITFDNDAGADVHVTIDRVLVRWKAIGVAAVQELLSLIEDPDQLRPPVLIPLEFHSTGTVSSPTELS